MVPKPRSKAPGSIQMFTTYNDPVYFHVLHWITTKVENSWKRAYVYGFDKIQDPTSDQHWLVFYNGRLLIVLDMIQDINSLLSWPSSSLLIRDGWLVGREAIGVSRLDMGVIDIGLTLD